MKAKVGLHFEEDNAVNLVGLLVWKLLFYEFLLNNQNVNSIKYCQRLDRLRQNIYDRIMANRRKGMFHEDYIKSLRSLMIHLKLYKCKWDVLPHPPRSLDLASSDFLSDTCKTP